MKIELWEIILKYSIPSTILGTKISPSGRGCTERHERNPKSASRSLKRAHSHVHSSLIAEYFNKAQSLDELESESTALTGKRTFFSRNSTRGRALWWVMDFDGTSVTIPVSGNRRR